MQITRTMSRSKEVVYNVTDGEVAQYCAVIDDDHVLLVAYPQKDMTRPHARAFEKLLVKAKQRDGIKTYRILLGYTMRDIEGELIISPTHTTEPVIV